MLKRILTVIALLCVSVHAELTLAKNGATEELKAKDQMAWVGLMNGLKNQAEEMILAELIYA